MTTTSSDGAAGRATLFACLQAIAERQGIAAPLREPSGRRTGRDAAQPTTARVLRAARAVGLRCRRLRGTWEDLRALAAENPAIVSFVDGSSLLLAGTRVMDNKAVVLLEDPRFPGHELIVVDRIRFVEVWTGEIVIVRASRGRAASTRFGWRTVSGLLAREPRLMRDLAGATLALGVLAAVPILFVQLLMQRVLPVKAGQSLLVLSLVLLVAVAIEGVLGGARAYLVSRLTGRLDARLATDIVDRLLRLPAAALERMPAGAALHRLGGRAAVRAMFEGPLLGAALEVGTACVMLLLIMAIDPLLGCVMVLLLALSSAAIYTAYARVRRGASLLRHAQARRHAFLLQTLRGIGTVKALALGSDHRRRWDRLTAAVGKAEFDASRVTDGIAAIVLPAERLLVVGTLGLGLGLAAAVGEPAQLAPLLTLTLLAQRLIAPLPSIAALVRARADAEAAMAELAALVNLPPEAQMSRPAVPQAIAGGIAFEDVRFRYPDRIAPALQAVSFAIEPGTTLGIMGRSGAGKSTIARLLQRHHAPQGGAIRLDGVDLADIDLLALRRAVAVVTSHDTLFAGTIRETITAARPDATFEEMVRAARTAGAEEFIDKLPRGYETLLHENAPALSSGQRQRLALARALVTEPRILILDEALSALDAEIEAVVDARLQEARRGLTTIIISHRLSALAGADAILVMADGEVRDVGPHADLLDRCDLYATAWARQQGAIEAPAPIGEGRLALF